MDEIDDLTCELLNPLEYVLTMPENQGYDPTCPVCKDESGMCECFDQD